MSKNSEEVTKYIFSSLGLPYRPCGLNADWSVSAWHIGPSPEPNLHPNDLYIIDPEYGDDVFALVKRDPTKDREEEILTILEGSLVAVATEALDRLTKLRQPNYKLPFTDAIRDRLKQDLAQCRYDGMFGDGLEFEYIYEGVTITGLNQMSDEELLAEYKDATGEDEDEQESP